MAPTVHEALLSAAHIAGNFKTAAVALLACQWEAAGLLPLEPFASPEDWYERQARRVRELCPLGPIAPPPPAFLGDGLRLLRGVDSLAIGGDALGPALEAWEPRAAKRNAGRYITPADVGRALLTLARFDPARCAREGASLVDCACGVGSLLAEAGARLADPASALDPFEAAQAILAHLAGVELDGDVAVLARVNLLLQLGPLLPALVADRPRLLRLLARGPAVITGDGLACYDEEATPHWPGRAFAWCVGNPPYLGEMGNRARFRVLRRTRAVAARHYHKDMDLLYWFIIAGLSRLEPGGRLAYITTAYWPEAESAAFVRDYIARHAVVEEIVLLDQASLFERAKGQHNMLFALRRKTTPACVGAPLVRVARRREALLSSDECYPLRSAPSVAPWPLRARPEAAAELDRMERVGIPLGAWVHIGQGVQTGANVATAAMLKWLPPDVAVGDGIFVVTREELDRIGLSPEEHALFVRPLCKTRSIRPWRARHDGLFVLVVRDDDALERWPALRAHLQRFRPVLERRKEFNRDEYGARTRPWYACKRARNRWLFDGPRILTPQQALRPCFAVVETPLCVGTDARVLTPRRADVDVWALAAVLHSASLQRWFAHRLKRKGEIMEFYGATFARAPIPSTLPSELGELARRCHAHGAATAELQAEIDRAVDVLFKRRVKSVSAGADRQSE